MAASSGNAVRVRLYFDYPPPSMPDCRMSWVLVDLNKCRVVADLCSVIRERFDYSRKTVLDLFIENCFLPPAESIYVVRDNDSIRVKVSSVSSEHTRKKRHREEEGLSQVPTKKNRAEPSEANGVAHPAGTTKKRKKNKAKKKKQDAQQAGSGDAVPAKEVSSSKTDQSSKKALVSSVLTNGKAIPDDNSSDSSEEVTQKSPPPKSKHSQIAASKRLAAKKSSSSDSSSSEDKGAVKKSQKPSTSLKTNIIKTPKEQTSSSVPLKSTTSTSTGKKTQKQSSSDSSSSEDEAPAAAKKADVSAKSSSIKQKSTNATSKTCPQTETDSSSSEEDESRKGGVSAVNSSKTNKHVLQTRPPSSSLQGKDTSKKSSGNSKISKMQKSSDSSSASEDEASETNVPATPKPCSDPCTVVENGVNLSTPVGTTLPDNKDKAERSDSCSSSDTELVIKRPNPNLLAGLTPRGRGRGFTDRVKGRGGVRGGFGRARGTPWKQNFHYTYDTEEQRRQKEVQTNRSLVLQNPPEPSPRQDYSTLPLLAAPPAVGQKIAFKLLELTENYTPEVSDYKEGKIIGINQSTNMVELELLTQSQARAEPGKFDLVYQNPDGSERVEYAVTVGSQLTERWESLLEPRLIMQNN